VSLGAAGGSSGVGGGAVSQDCLLPIGLTPPSPTPVPNHVSLMSLVLGASGGSSGVGGGGAVSQDCLLPIGLTPL